MKKFGFFLLVVFAIINVKAQTYEETQLRVGNEICQAQNKLNVIKDRIYYLEITLNNKIKEDSILKPSGKKYLLSRSGNLEQLRKERFFAKDELVSLKIQKQEFETTLTSLNQIALDGTQYRVKTDMKSNLPEKMGRYEYNRRTRAQMFKASEDKLNGEISLKEYPGLLANLKTGQNEIAKFTITRIDFPEFVPIVKVLNPGERLFVNLPIGDYHVQVDCGSFSRVYQANVNPLSTKHFDYRDVYWYGYKDLSDR